MGKVVSNIVSTGLMIAGAMMGGPAGWAMIAAGMATQFAGSVLFKDKQPSGYRDQSERKQMLRSAVAPETIIVGKTVCSGLLFFAEEEKGEQTENERLFLALALAAHKVDRIGQIWLNDDLIGTFGDKASYEFHNGRTECDPYMLKNAPSWKSDMIGEGLAWLRLTLKYDAEKFPYGVPNVKVEVWGKQIYDPRKNQTVWSNNGALIVLDFYRSYLGVSDSDIDFEAFKVAADLCDEPVVSPEGVSESRYTINGAYELSESPSSILDHMHKCIAAEPTYVAGKHGILMQAYNGPAVLRIEPNQIIDTVNITPELALRDATNAIYGTFIDSEQQYIQTDFEPVVIDEWVDEDGLEIKENMDYRFVSSPYQASRLANLYLRKKRAGRRVQLKMNMDGYAYRPGDVVLLNLPHIGIQNLEFRVAEWKFHPQEGVDILLEEDGAYIYEDIIGKPFVRPPFTVLPTGGVAPPLNLAFVATNIGDVVQGYLSWQSAAADVRYSTVNIIENGKVIQSIQVPHDRVDLSGLVRGSYRAEVRSINAAGAVSAPAIVDFDIQAPPQPVSVEMVGGMFSLTCIPHGGETAQHGYTFEFWFSDKKLTSTNDQDVTTKANRQGQGQFWTKENLKAGTDYWFYVRTVNSYGKSQFVEAAGQASGTPKDMIDELGNNFLTTEAGKIMQDQIGDIALEQLEIKHDIIDINNKTVALDNRVVQINTDVGIVSEAVLQNTIFTTQLSFKISEEKADRKAEIFRLEQVQVTDREAAARWQEQISVSVASNTSSILEVKEAQATYEEASAKQINQVKADVEGVTGRVTEVETATATLTEAQAKFERSTIAQFEEHQSYITHIETSVSNVEMSVSEALMQTAAQFTSLSDKQLKSEAKITKNEKAIATETEARAEMGVQIDARFNDAEGAIVRLDEAQAEQDKSLAKTTEQLRAEIKIGDDKLQEGIDEQVRELSKVSSSIDEQKLVIAELDKTLTEVTQQSASRFDDNEASINSIQRTQSDTEMSQAETAMQLSAQQFDQSTQLLRARASIIRIDKAVADNDRAYAQTFEQISTQFNDVNSSITTLKKSVSDNEKAQAETNELIKSEIGDNKSAIELRGQTVFDHQGNGSAVYTIKTGIWWDGQYYDAKFMMGAEVKNGKVVTQIGFSADTFGIFNPKSGKLEPVFFVENGQVFINDAFINQATIEKLLIGSTIKSKNWEPAAKKGLMLDFEKGKLIANDAEITGTIYAKDGEFNGTVYVHKLIGDNATATVYKQVTKRETHGNTYDQAIETSVIYVGGMPYDVDLLMPTMQFESTGSYTDAIANAYVSVIIDGVTYTPQTTTVKGGKDWSLICSLYVTIPASKKDVKITIKYITYHSGGCDTKIHPAMIIACKHNSSSFK